MRGVPWWGVLSAVASPVLLTGGFIFAATLQPPSYNSVTDTVSALAAIGATDRWVMTLVFVVVGVCDVATGVALRPAAPIGRLVLIGGAVSGMLVAAYPENPWSASVPHAVWAVLGFFGLATWPVWARRRGLPVPWALRPSACWAAVTVEYLLLAWFLAELITSAQQAGLAERAAGVAQAVWPLVVVLSSRRASWKERRRAKELRGPRTPSGGASGATKRLGARDGGGGPGRAAGAVTLGVVYGSRPVKSPREHG
jgi:hypothetical membrane protein